MGVMLILLGVVGVGVGFWGLVLGRVSFLRIASRKAALLVLGGALGAMIAGGAMMPPAPASTTPSAAPPSAKTALTPAASKPVAPKTTPSPASRPVTPVSAKASTSAAPKPSSSSAAKAPAPKASSAVSSSSSSSAASPPLTNADWPSVQVAPDLFASKKVILDVEVASTIAGTAGTEVSAFTQYNDFNPFDATVVDIPVGAATPASGTYLRITGTVLGSTQTKNAFGTVFTLAEVSADTATVETCAAAFGAACTAA